MALSQNVYTVGTSAVKVSPTDTFTSATIVIQNNHGSNIVYIGDSTVTSSSYGVQLLTGASVSLDNLSMGMAVYAISSGASTPVSVLAITR